MNPTDQILYTIEGHIDKPFLIDASTGQSLSYGRFHHAACNLAAEFRARVGEGNHRLAILMENSLEFAISYFACFYSGLTAVPINPELHRREQDFILDHSGAEWIVLSEKTQGMLGPVESHPLIELSWAKDNKTKAADTNQIEVSHLLSIPRDEKYPLKDGGGSKRPSTITFTSGTTGDPKGVCHKAETLFGNASAFNERMHFGPQNSFLHFMPMSYMAGLLNSIISPFLAGASVTLVPAFNAMTALTFWRTLVQHRINAFWATPTMLYSFMSLDRDHTGENYCKNNPLTICVGTAPLPGSLKKSFVEKYRVELYESYGLSELLIISGNDPDKEFPSKGVGRILPGVKVVTIDAEGKTLNTGEAGEIIVRTPYVMDGYLNYQTLDSNPVTKKEFATGDVGYVDPEGCLHLTGRKKDLIIKGGINISPRAIEDVLLEMESVDQVAVIGSPDDFYGENIAAAIVFKSGCDLKNEEEALVHHCKKNLSDFSIPARFYQLKELPRNHIGKVQKGKLKDKLFGNG